MNDLAPVANLGRQTFEVADQTRFAALSGDLNPLHMDAVVARRLLTGRQVVHGVHTLLCALERWPTDWPGPCWRIDAEFLNPISVGDTVNFMFTHDDLGAPSLAANVGGLICCRVGLATVVVPHEALPPGTVAETIEPGLQALDRDALSWVGQHQVLELPKADFGTAFALTCASLGERRVAAIALLSTYVGMVCPGLHSVFSSLSVEPGDEHAPALRFEVRRYDPRFRIFIIRFDGPVRGEIKAFLRAPAQVQPSTASLQALLQPGEFSGTRHWVIGGSRGLGELVAKLLAGGGAQVTLSYATGAADAERVVQDIAAAGAPAAQARHLDLETQGFDDWLSGAPWPDAVWYFATPRIFRKKSGLFDAELLDEFISFYVRRFEALCQGLETAANGRKVTVFYPSTTFVDERPKGMTEYTMAKAAAEVLIADLARSLQWVRPLARRLPRLATDQTAGLSSKNAPSNSEVMLPVLREALRA